MGTYKRLSLTIKKGLGSWVWDDQGKKYLDAVAGIATVSLGHSDSAMRKALNIQLKKVQHVSNLYQIPEQEELANWLVQKSFAESVFFCNSGAEANEASIKLARKYGNTKKGINRPIILSCKNSFHGRTFAAISASGQPKYHKGFEPLVEGFDFFSYNNWDSFTKLVDKLDSHEKRVSAVIIEPIQGEGGIIPGNKNFFKSLREFCSFNEILLIFDEVQTGMGRTGKLWAYEYLEVEPDVMTIAKGLGGGHAIGALLATTEASIFEQGDHASTFGGNPFACKAAITVGKEIYKRGLLKKVTERSKQLEAGLNEIKIENSNLLVERRGVGLMQGLVINQEEKLTSQDVIETALEHKLLVISAGPKVVRIVPPLTIKEREIKILIKRLRETFKVLNSR